MENGAKREETFQLRAMHVSGVTLIINGLLTLLKLAAGIAGHSQAMISDAAHSASDVLSTLVVMAGVKLSSKKPDQGHPYGHERLECEASIILAGLLLVTAAGIGGNGILKIMGRGVSGTGIPGLSALAAAVLSIAVKEWMYRYTKKAAKETGYCSLMADAWHHRSDAFSSVGALIGIVGARLGLTFLDPLAGVAISLLIGKTALSVFCDTMDQMVDKSCGECVVKRMEETAASLDGVERVDEIRTRRFGTRVYVDMEIAADGELLLFQAHGIAELVHQTVEETFPEVKHCMVHVNPYCGEGAAENKCEE